MSKGGSSVTVTDYRMTIDFGICYGVLNSINSIYIKETRVWCGYMTSPGSIDINLPDLFGGDLAEGGVVGTIEAWFGTDDQVMSDSAAAQYDLTPSTMPGYRQLGHAMFRGEGTNPDLGFKWAVNNPYLPSTWINVTRIPDSLSEEYAFIYPNGRDYSTTIDGPLDVNDGYHTVDPVAIGANVEDIDAGLVSISYYVTGAFVLTYGSGSNIGLVQLFLDFYDENGDLIPGTSVSFNDFTDGTLTQQWGGPLPVGCRTYRYKAVALATYPIYTNTTITSDGTLTFPSIGPSWCNIDGTFESQAQANPAHMIYEALNSEDLGMGSPRESFDLDSFMYAAQTFYNEGFGLTILWTDQSDIEAYVGEILNHVQAALFLSPVTGLWTLVPFRDDYDIDTIPVIDPSNCELDNPQRKGLGETVNEIVIEWTNPDSEETETITFQDPGNIAAQGSLVSKTNNYYGIRSAALANVVGDRDIRSASYPLFATEAFIDRTVPGLFPGGVVKLNWPADGIENMVLRIGDVDYGAPGDRVVKCSLTEDIFALEKSTFTTIQRTKWVSQDETPTPFDHIEIQTAPLALYLRGGQSLSNISDDDYPSVPLAVLADREGGGIVSSFDLMGDTVKANGEITTGRLAVLLPTPSGTLATALGYTVQSTLPDSEVQAFCGLQAADTGSFLIIGSGDATSEIVMLDSYNSGTETWTLARGMFDTVPRVWPIGTRVWFIGDALREIDPTEEADGVSATFYLLPTSSGGKLALADASPVSFTPSGRPYAPIRPVNFSVDYILGATSEPYEVELQNGGAESSTTSVPDDWTCSNVTSVGTYPGGLAPRTGTKMFHFGGTVGYDSEMTQTLSIPRGLYFWIDDATIDLHVNWFIGSNLAANVNTDQIWVEVEWLDEAGTPISTSVGDLHVPASASWAAVEDVFPPPAGARSYVVHVKAHKTSGTTLDSYADDVSVGWFMGDFQVYSMALTEVPATIDISWANRNRLMEDSLPPRLTAGNVTPEVGQTTTIRVRDAYDEALVVEHTGITGTTYTLDLSPLTGYRHFRIDLIAERDGFESLQFMGIHLILVRATGYGNGYGFDYGSP